MKKRARSLAATLFALVSLPFSAASLAAPLEQPSPPGSSWTSIWGKRCAST